MALPRVYPPLLVMGIPELGEGEDAGQSLAGMLRALVTFPLTLW